MKIGSYAATAGYMDAMGVPGELLPVVIAFEVLAAIALIIGWKTRLTAFPLAGFTLLSGVVGAGALSLDRRASKSPPQRRAATTTRERLAVSDPMARFGGPFVIVR